MYSHFADAENKLKGGTVAKASSPVITLCLGQWSLHIVPSGSLKQYFFYLFENFYLPSLNASPLNLIMYSEKSTVSTFQPFSNLIIPCKKPILSLSVF